MAALTNPARTLRFPLLAGWAALRFRRLKQRHLTEPVLALAIAVICFLPWTIRNYKRFHALVPMRCSFVFELYVGNNENYEDENRLPPGAITQERAMLRYFRMGETAFMEEVR